MDSELETETNDSAGPEMETAENATPESERDDDAAPEMEADGNTKPETEADGNTKPETETDDNTKPEMETSFSNPWNVSDASVFLKYCCPECDYQFVQLEIFVIHATQYHDLSKILFEETKINSKHVKEEPFSELLENSEVIEEAFEAFDDFIEDDNYIDDPDFDEDKPIKLHEKRKKTSESDPIQTKTKLSQHQKDLDEQEREPSCEKGQDISAIHDKAKPFKCDFCDTYFVTKNSLKAHNFRFKTKHIELVHEQAKGCDIAFAKNPVTIEMDENCWLTCDKCPNEKFYFIFELQLHREKVHKNEVKQPTTKTDRNFIVDNFANRQMIFQKNGWACTICEPEVKFEHKFQMITHWHEKHSSGGLYEPCQWCCEVFQSPDQNLVSSISKLHST